MCVHVCVFGGGGLRELTNYSVIETVQSSIFLLKVYQNETMYLDITIDSRGRDWKRDHVSLCLQCKASGTVRVATYDTLRCDFTGFEVKRSF